MSTSPSLESDALPVKVEPPPPPDTACSDACTFSDQLCEPFDGPACLTACDAGVPDGGSALNVKDCLTDAGFSCSASRACLRPPANPPFAPGPYGTKVRDLAGPFTLTLPEGDWDFASEWTGQDSYLFLAYAPGTSGGGIDTNRGLFAGNLRPLLDASPRNVHYVFGWLRDQPGFEGVRQRWTQELHALPEPDRSWWLARVHFQLPALDQTPGWIGQMMTARWANPPRYLGNELTSFAIDRFQRIREVGMLGRLAQNGVAPDLSMLRHEAEAFNLEADTEARLARQSARVLTLATAQTAYDRIDVDVTWPDEAELAQYDTLEADLFLGCPEHRNTNCGAWDYLSHLRRCELAGPIDGGVNADGGTGFLPDGGFAWTCNEELARWITPYWREGRWVTDISAQLATLRPGPNHLRWTASGQWDPRRTDYVVSLSLRLSNSQRGVRPVAAIPLWTGGNLNDSYNAAHPPKTVDVPADAVKVELVTLTTGHGGVQPTNCAEFCNHQHVFSVNGVAHRQSFPEAQQPSTCAMRVPAGVVPNQHGTWYFGRGGWCPGQDVPPWVVDVTAEVMKGQPNTLTYRAEFQGAPVTGNLGNVVLSSWLVVWR
ncbi:MAG: peptide-N-glycosidase F-related protein [Myxococcota bacterium]